MSTKASREGLVDVLPDSEACRFLWRNRRKRLFGNVWRGSQNPTLGVGITPGTARTKRLCGLVLACVGRSKPSSGGRMGTYKASAILGERADMAEAVADGECLNL